MKFVDRHDEQRRLMRLLDLNEASLVVVWGRRRIGKTRLLLDWVRRSGGIYWVADESAAQIQRQYLASAIEAALPGFGQVEYRDWGALFTRLARDAKQAGFRGPVVIDELPYLLGASPELPSVLQRVVDHEARQAKLVLALSGSSQRMMQGLTLSASAPLYGRARELVKLGPIPAGYLGAALGLRDARAIVETYACWGGIPRYWELAQSLGDLRGAVDALVLDPRGALHDEPARLLLDELPSAVSLRPLLDVVGAGAHKVSEIAGRVGQPASSLSRPLARLQELELVTREAPFGESERPGKRALYKLSDPFMRLWFSLVGPRRAQLMQAAPSTRGKLFADRLPHLVAAAWEDLCRQAVPKLASALGDTGYGPASRYWLGQGPEWDVVARAVDGKGLLLGECKWLAHDPSAADIATLAEKLVAKGTPAAVPSGGLPQRVLFVPTVPRGMRRMVGNTRIVDAATVLEALK